MCILTDAINEEGARSLGRINRVGIGEDLNVDKLEHGLPQANISQLKRLDRS